MATSQPLSNPRKGTKLPDHLAELRIEELPLSIRSFNVLRANEIKTLGQLVLLSDDDLLKFHSFGKTSLQDVRRAIAHVWPPDLSVAGTEPSAKRRLENADTQESAHHKPAPAFRHHWKLPLRRVGNLDAHVDVLDLSTRSRNVLVHWNVRCVRDILSLSKQDLLSSENLGRKSLDEIERKLYSYLSGDQTSHLTFRLPPTEGQTTRQFAGTKASVEMMLSRLPERQKGVIADRYGLWDGIAETLQDIGDKLGVTRERVRQIEEKGLTRLRRVHGHGTIRTFIAAKLRSHLDNQAPQKSGILSEDEAVTILSDDCTSEQAALAVEFLQDIECPDRDLFARCLIEAEPGVFCANRRSLTSYTALLDLIEQSLQSFQKPVSEDDLLTGVKSRASDLTSDQGVLLHRILDVSPSVLRLRNGTVAFSSWTEFKRRDALSLAEATLRLLGRPAHFREITEHAGRFFPDVPVPNERAIHSALIAKRKQFVWVKSGTYGLAAWGLTRPPYIKDRLIELLSETRYPLPYWHLQEKVLEVCNCKADSVRMTLDLNSALFKKFEGDQYGLRYHYPV